MVQITKCLIDVLLTHFYLKEKNGQFLRRTSYKGLLLETDRYNQKEIKMRKKVFISSETSKYCQ